MFTSNDKSSGKWAINIGSVFDPGRVGELDSFLFFSFICWGREEGEGAIKYGGTSRVRGGEGGESRRGEKMEDSGVG